MQGLMKDLAAVIAIISGLGFLAFVISHEAEPRTVHCRQIDANLAQCKLGQVVCVLDRNGGSFCRTRSKP